MPFTIQPFQRNTKLSNHAILKIYLQAKGQLRSVVEQFTTMGAIELTNLADNGANSVPTL